MEKVDIKRLAKELNLSISTVSRALRDSYEISAGTKQKVFELAQKLNYQPNPHASSLREQRTRTIALVLPEVANNFFALAISGIESVAASKGYHVLIYLTHESEEKEIDFIQQLSGGRVDGILMSVSVEGGDVTHLDKLIQKNIPLVFFDRVHSALPVPQVVTDDYESSFRAAEHLIARGCRKPAILVVSGNMYIGGKRKQGFLDALHKHGISGDLQHVLDCPNDMEKSYRMIRDLLGREHPDGIFASVEKLAIASYSCCRDLGLRIPGDLKIIGFSNLQIAALLNPSLTTVTQPAFEMGKEAAQLLFNLIAKKPVEEQVIVLQSELIKRDSTGDS
jgi:LacI family transcriptional regulator